MTKGPPQNPIRAFYTNRETRQLQPYKRQMPPELPETSARPKDPYGPHFDHDEVVREITALGCRLANVSREQKRAAEVPLEGHLGGLQGRRSELRKLQEYRPDLKRSIDSRVASYLYSADRKFRTRVRWQQVECQLSQTSSAGPVTMEPTIRGVNLSSYAPPDDTDLVMSQLQTMGSRHAYFKDKRWGSVASPERLPPKIQLRPADSTIRELDRPSPSPTLIPKYSRVPNETIIDRMNRAQIDDPDPAV